MKNQAKPATFLSAPPFQSKILDPHLMRANLVQKSVFDAMDQ